MAVIKYKEGGVVKTLNIPGGGSGGSAEFIGVRANCPSTSVANTTWTLLDFDGSETFDTSSIHDPASNPEQFTIPQDGYYDVHAVMTWDSNSTGDRALLVSLNGATISTPLNGAQSNIDAANSVDTVQSVHLGSHSLTAGDVLRLHAYQNSGSSRTISGYFTVTLRTGGTASSAGPDPTGATAGQVWTADGSGGADWAAASSGHTIQDEGTSLAQRTALDFQGDGVTVENATATQSDYEDAVIALSPWVYYLTDETSGTDAIDASGNGRDGTYAGTYTLDQAGPGAAIPKSVNIAYGGSSRIEVPIAGFPDINSSGLSFGGWVKTVSGSQYVRPLFIDNIGDSFRLRLSLNSDENIAEVSGKISFDVTRPSGGGAIATASSSSTSVNDGNWHYVGFSWDGGSGVTIYLDGSPLSLSTWYNNGFTESVSLDDAFYMGSNADGDFSSPFLVPRSMTNQEHADLYALRESATVPDKTIVTIPGSTNDGGFKGAWDNATDYASGDTVTHNSSLWGATSNPAVADEPGVAAAWSEISTSGGSTTSSGALMRRVSTDQSVSATTETVVTFTETQWQSGDVSADYTTGQFTVASDGIYDLHATISTDATNINDLRIITRVNGTAFTPLEGFMARIAQTGSYSAYNGSIPLQLQANDTVSVVVYGGVGFNVRGGVASFASLVRVGDHGGGSGGGATGLVLEEISSGVLSGATSGTISLPSGYKGFKLVVHARSSDIDGTADLLACRFTVAGVEQSGASDYSYAGTAVGGTANSDTSADLIGIGVVTNRNTDDYGFVEAHIDSRYANSSYTTSIYGDSITADPGAAWRSFYGGTLQQTAAVDGIVLGFQHQGWGNTSFEGDSYYTLYGYTGGSGGTSDGGFKGAWDNATDYVLGDTVTHNSSLWGATSDPAVADEPGVAAAWTEITTSGGASSGATGGASARVTTDNQATSAGSWHTIDLEATDFEQGDVSVDLATDRFTVAKTGLYLASASASIGSATSSATAYLSASVNGGTTADVDRFDLQRGDTTYANDSLGGSRLLSLTAGDTVEFLYLEATANTIRNSSNYFSLVAVGGSSSVAAPETGLASYSGGSVTVTSTTFGGISPAAELDVTLDAAEGDVVVLSLSASGLAPGSGSYTCYDVATMVSSSPVNYASSGTGTATSHGVLGWLHGQTTVERNTGGTVLYTVQAGDISGGQVTFRPMTRVTGGSGTVYASTSSPVTFYAHVLGGGSASASSGPDPTGATAGYVWTADGADGADWAALPAGATGTVTQVTTTSGSIAVSVQTPTQLGDDLVVSGLNAGDWILIGVNGLVDGTSGDWLAIDAATRVSNVDVNWVSGHNDFSASIGVLGWLLDDAVGFSRLHGYVPYQIQSGDIEGSTVTFRLYGRNGNTGTRTVRAISTSPLKFMAVPVGASTAGTNGHAEYARATALGISAATNTVIPFDGGGSQTGCVSFDTDTFTVSEDGLYLVRAGVAFTDGTPRTDVRLIVNKTGSDTNWLARQDMNGQWDIVHGSQVHELTAGDTIQIKVYATQASNLAGNQYTRASVTKIGGAGGSSGPDPTGATAGYVWTADGAGGADWAELVEAGHSVNTQTGTSYTLALSDNEKLVALDNTSPIVVTVPENASVALPVGTHIYIAQISTGKIILEGSVTVSLNGQQSLGVKDGYGTVELLKVATDEWSVSGDWEAPPTPTIIDSTVSAGGTSISAPSGIQEGDLLIGLMASQSGSPTLEGFTIISSTGGTVARSYIFVKRATASEPGSYAITGISGGDEGSLYLSAWRNAEILENLGAPLVQTIPSDSTVTFPEQSLGSPGYPLVQTVKYDSSAAISYTSADNYSTLYSVQVGGAAGTFSVRATTDDPVWIARELTMTPPTTTGSGVDESGCQRIFVVWSDQTGPTNVADLSSGSATDGYVATADGAGGVAWESLPATTTVTAIPTFTAAHAAGVGGLNWYNDTGGAINVTGVRASISAAAVSAATVIDVNVDGTSALDSPLSISVGQTTTGKVADSISIADGSYISIDIDSVGSPSANETVMVQFYGDGS